MQQKAVSSSYVATEVRLLIFFGISSKNIELIFFFGISKFDRSGFKFALKSSQMYILS